MSTFYIDLESGNDSFGGDSFNVTASGTNGATTTNSFSLTSAGANFTTALIGRPINILTRGFYYITGVPSTTVLNLTSYPGGLGTPAGGTGLTYYIGGRWRTTTNAGPYARPCLANDEIRVMASPSPVLIGNATWTRGSSAVVFDSTVAQVVDPCDSGWVAGNANVTITTTGAGTGKDGTGTTQMAIAAGFTTGLIAYKNLNTTLDLSNYNTLNFWINAGATTQSVSAYRIALCSDTAGLVPVNTFNLPPIVNTGSYPVAYTLSAAGPLGNSIRSVALSAVVAPGAVTVRLDHITATLPGGVNLTTLISKNNNDPRDMWWSIKTLSGNRVTLDAGGRFSGLLSVNAAYASLYPLDTENVPTYAITPISLGQRTGGPAQLYTHNWTDNILSTGTTPLPTNTYNPNSKLFVSGGWDRSTMSSQVFKTYLDSMDFSCRVFTLQGNSVVYSNFGFCKIYGGFFLSSLYGCEIYNCEFTQGLYLLEASSATSCIVRDCNFNSGATGGFSTVATTNLLLTGCNFYNGPSMIQTGNNDTRGVYRNNYFYNCATRLNESTCTIAGSYNSEFINNYFENCGILSNATIFVLNFPLEGTVVYNLSGNQLVNIARNPNFSQQIGTNDAFLTIQGINGDLSDIRVYQYRSTILSERTIRNSNQGYAWRITTDKYQTAPLWYPIQYKIATVAARAGVPVKVSASIFSTKTNLNGLSAGLMSREDTIYNLPENRSYVNNTVANTFLPVTWTITPTVDSVIPVYFFATLPANADYSIIDSISIQ